MFDENIISREYIKSHLFPMILKHLGDFLDHDKLERINDKLILPLKDNLDSDLLKKKSVQLRILLKEFIENNQDLQNLVKQRFANKLNINISELEIFNINQKLLIKRELNTLKQSYKFYIELENFLKPLFYKNDYNLKTASKKLNKSKKLFKNTAGLTLNYFFIKKEVNCAQK